MKLTNLKLLLLFLTYLNVESFAAPTESILSLVTTSTKINSSNNEDIRKKRQVETEKPEVPKITQMQVTSNITNRFAYTTITSKVKNAADKAQEAIFSVVLPETAFISKFVMEVDGQNYTAYVKEKEEAKKVYDQAVARGAGAAHIAVSARDSHRFTVSVNIEPEKKAAFYLTYEQLLKREDGHYEQIININPGQLVKDLSVEVAISESRKITDLKAPPLRSGNEIQNENAELDPRADIEVVNETAAVVRFSPNLERQKQLAKLLKTEENYGFSGQFVVQYDVERDPTGGEVLVQDGYFVHFFAPTDLQPLPKHIVFVLDTSSSMFGDKIQQLKEAMGKILEQLNPKDLFHLVEFNSNVRVYDLQDPNKQIWFQVPDTETNSDNSTFPNAYSANQENIKIAKDTVSKLEADGGTDIMTALTVGLHLTDLTKRKNVDEINRQPIILFLTDGEPSVGETSTHRIIEKVSELNTGSKQSPIFSLSFGSGADKKFLQTLSLRNYGFSKHIYEAADASLQLQDFYQQISSPLLADVKFKYEPSVTSLTKTEFPIHFGGSEIVVAGFCAVDLLELIEVDGIGSTGLVSLKPTVERTISSTERLWAYLTVQQLLEKMESSDQEKEKIRKEALDLALKYSFVTPLTSLVVVKPNDTSPVDTVEASKVPYYGDSSDYSATGVELEAYAEEDFEEYVDDLSTPMSFEPTVYSPEEKIAEADLLEDLLVKLPWLKYLLDKNNFVKLSTGSYKLGLSETIENHEACPKSETGHCVLLKDCPKLYPILTTLEDYIQRSCLIKNEYAGICCPMS